MSIWTPQSAATCTHKTFALKSFETETIGCDGRLWSLVEWSDVDRSDELPLLSQREIKPYPAWGPRGNMRHPWVAYAMRRHP